MANDDTRPIKRQTIPSDPEARRQWAASFTHDLLNHPHDEGATWVLREEDHHPIR